MEESVMEILSTDLVVEQRSTSSGQVSASMLITKRLIDVCVSVIFLVLFSPILLLIAGLILVLEGRPIFYRHQRIGWKGRAFGCIKFRTMRADADVVLAELLKHDSRARAEWEFTRKLKDDPRVTRIGAVLRKTSLDELPQLFNILAGDMGLVGPRPVMRVELLEHYQGAAGEAYVSVRPGLTGLWQVSGRSDSDYRRRVELDCQYVRNLSILTDFNLLFRTVFVVLARRGAY